MGVLFPLDIASKSGQRAIDVVDKMHAPPLESIANRVAKWDHHLIVRGVLVHVPVTTSRESHGP